MSEGEAITRRMCYDLNKIPLKSVTIIESDAIKNGSTRLPHGCIVGCPKNENISKNPMKMVEKLESMTSAKISFGTFLFIRNYDEITKYYFNVNNDTIFYYIKFEHRHDCSSFNMCTKNEFYVCLFVKKISLKHVHEWRKWRKPIKTTKTTRLPPPINNDAEKEEKEEKEEKKEKEESVTPPPTNHRNYNNHNNHNHDNIDLTKIISTPHGNLSINQLLRYRFRENNVCFIWNVPIFVSYPNIITSKPWFGQFGSIKHLMIINDDETNSNSQFRSIYIIYNDEKSAEFAINFCNNNAFENNVKLSASFGILKYCRFFLMNKQCRFGTNCIYKHCWNYNMKNIINKPFYDKSKETLRANLEILAQKIGKIPLDKLPEIFRIHFHRNIHHLYIGKLKDLILYFPDLFKMEYDRKKNKLWMVSRKINYHNQGNKINDNDNNNIHKHCNETIKSLQIYIKNYDDMKKDNLRLQQKCIDLERELNENKTKNKIDINNECKVKFRNWLFDIVGLQQYLTDFENKGYDNYSFIEFLDQDTIKNDLNITLSIHHRLLLKRVNQHKIMMAELDKILNKNADLNQYKQQFIQYGILTLNDLRNDIKTINDVQNILNIKNSNKAQSILQIVQHLDVTHNNS